MDYTNDPDCKLPLALIVNMPELKVKKCLKKNPLQYVNYDVTCKLFANGSASFYPRCVLLCVLFWIVLKETLLKQTWHPPLMCTDT